MEISKEGILSLISTYDILNYYLKPYHQLDKLLQGKHISNPFLSTKQKTPSFYIYRAKPKPKWRYYDPATRDSGDCFDLVKRLFKLDFASALRKIDTDFGLGLRDDENISALNLKRRAFTQAELDYWARYGISVDVLQKYRVVALSEFSSNSSSGKRYTYRSSPSQFIFAYDRIAWAKVYRPSESRFKFLYLGDKPSAYMFGYEELPAHGDMVFLAAGEKDTLSLSARGYPAFCLNSETANLSAEVVEEMKRRFTHFIVIYDNDDTGLKQSERLCNQYSIKNLVLPIMKNGKDISDFFEQGRSNKELDELIIQLKKSQLTDSSLLGGNGFPNEQVKENDEHIDAFFKTPTIPEYIYTQLPSLLLRGCEVLDDNREKDVFLTTALATIGGCLNFVSGIYNRQTVYPNLFVFVIAPPASGKGGVSFARCLAEPLHKLIKENSRARFEQYESELEAWNAIKKGNKKDKGKAPEKPNNIILLIPANCSSAALIAHLEQSDGVGIFIDSEADSMANSFKNDWGGYSDLLRKAFHQRDQDT